MLGELTVSKTVKSNDAVLLGWQREVAHHHGSNSCDCIQLDGLGKASVKVRQAMVRPALHGACHLLLSLVMLPPLLLLLLMFFVLQNPESRALASCTRARHWLLATSSDSLCNTPNCGVRVQPRNRIRVQRTLSTCDSRGLGQMSMIQTDHNSHALHFNVTT